MSSREAFLPDACLVYSKSTITNLPKTSNCQLVMLRRRAVPRAQPPLVQGSLRGSPTPRLSLWEWVELSLADSVVPLLVLILVRWDFIGTGLGAAESLCAK